MCLLRIRDFKACGHAYVKPLFCVSSTVSKNGTLHFCSDVSNQGFEQSEHYCQHCMLVNDIVNDSARMSSPAKWKQHMAVQQGHLRHTLKNLEREIKIEDGILVLCLNEMSDRGLGEQLRLNTKHMLPPTKKSKNLKVRFAGEHMRDVIGTDGGSEWQGNDCTDIFQIPNGLRFVELTSLQAGAWWRDRQAYESDDEGFWSLEEFWGKESVDKNKKAEWRLSRMLSWLDNAADERSGSGQDEERPSTLVKDDVYLGWKFGRISSKALSWQGLTSLAALRDVEVGEAVDNFNEGVIVDEAGDRVFTVTLSTGESAQWVVKK